MKKKFKNLVIAFLLGVIILPNGVKAVNQNAAKVGDVEYATLEEAVSAANEGDTISILQDLDMTDRSWEVLIFPDNAILDLNGFTITTVNVGLIYTGINLTIKNGTFATDGSYALFIGDVNDTDKVLVEDIKTIGGINVFNATNVVLKNVTSVGHNYYSVWADEHALITIESGNYSTEGNYVLGIVKEEETSYIHVNGGTFTTTDGNLVLGSPNKPPVIYGGTFDTNPSEYVAEGPKIKEIDGKYIVAYEKNISASMDNNVKIANQEEVTNIILDSIDIDVSKKNIVVDIVSENTTVDKETENNMLDVINKKYKNVILGKFFDISIQVKDADSNESLGNVSELKEKIEFTVDIPQEFINNDNNIERTYYIIREHGDSYEILDTKISSDGKTLTFASDKFSTYGIFYTDNNLEEIKENPNTSDNIGSYILKSTILVVALGGIIFYLKRGKDETKC